MGVFPGQGAVHCTIAEGRTEIAEVVRDGTLTQRGERWVRGTLLCPCLRKVEARFM